MSKTVLSARNLHYRFEDAGSEVCVLQDVSLEVNAGELTAVVGPSGCGKSTLLYLLGLLDKPDSGEIFLDGESISQSSEDILTEIRNRKIGFVFQFHFLINELTVLENARLPILKSGADLSFATEQATEILNALGLSSKLNRPAFKLSGGEQQRVAVARALANSPSLILADEPTGNLDSANSESVFLVLKQFAKEREIGVVMVTHNMDLALRSDKVVKMRDGKILS